MFTYHRWGSYVIFLFQKPLACFRKACELQKHQITFFYVRIYLEFYSMMPVVKGSSLWSLTGTATPELQPPTRTEPLSCSPLSPTKLLISGSPSCVRTPTTPLLSGWSRGGSHVQTQWSWLKRICVVNQWRDLLQEKEILWENTNILLMTVIPKIEVSFYFKS